MVLPLDFIDSVLVLLTELLVLVGLNSDCCRLNFWMVSSLRLTWVINQYVFFKVSVILSYFTFVHGLVEYLNGLLVTER